MKRTPKDVKPMEDFLLQSIPPISIAGKEGRERLLSAWHKAWKERRQILPEDVAIEG